MVIEVKTSDCLIFAFGDNFPCEGVFTVFPKCVMGRSVEGFIRCVSLVLTSANLQTTLSST